jgi:hypothetical protein
VNTFENSKDGEMDELEGLNRVHQEIRKLSALAEEKLARNEFGSQELRRLRAMLSLQLQQAAALPAALTS